jgi:GT2 family glycosyltransferase
MDARPEPTEEAGRPVRPPAISEIAQLRREYDELWRAHERLRQRKAVRLALRLATVTRPLFTLRDRFTSASHNQLPVSADVTAVDTAEQHAAGGSSHDAAVSPLTPEVLRLLDLVPPPTIIVPIYNAYEELVRCIDALFRNTTVRARILLIDDASTDPRIEPFLKELQAFDEVTVLRNEQNLGFVQTVNRGFETTTGDVLILNSDTEVTPRWLENVSLAAYRHPLVGTVTPLSDNAGAFSAPEMGVANLLPTSHSKDEIGRLVTRNSARCYPTGPTGNGFCMYMKRAFLETVGTFDARSFPRGYGEENDLCMRGLKAGWHHIVDDATYIFHTRSASFGDEKQVLLEEAQRRLNELHPEYRGLVREFLGSESLALARSRVAAAFQEAEAHGHSQVRTRILYVLHAGVGGTPETNMDLMEALENSHESYVLVSDTRTVRLFSVRQRELHELEAQTLPETIGVADFHRAEYWRFVVHVLTTYAIELIHVRQLFKHTLDIVGAANGLNIPVVMSFHDYYYVCPTIHLLDDKDQFCGGECTPGQGTCRIPESLRDGPQLKHSWVYVWRDEMREMFEGVDAFVTTTQTAKDVYLRAFPELGLREFQTIEHGRDLARASRGAAPPKENESIRVLLPGTMAINKGAEFIRAIKERDHAGRVEFHFLGDPFLEMSNIGMQHGPYLREDYADRVATIAPHFIGLFSIWAETYSHTLTEAWALGIPVIASDLGALGERVHAHGGGWLVDVTDAGKAYETIIHAASDSVGYARAVAEAITAPIRSIREMKEDYEALYASVLKRRRVFANTASAAET